MAIGFLNDEGNEQNGAIVDPTFTNAICYGQTGSGKTTGFILPNIENRIKLNHGLLIYDFKGNLHVQVKALAKKYDKLKYIYEIGKPWGESIDILKYISDKSLESMFVSIAGKSSDDYWTQSAYNLFTNVYHMLKNLITFFEIVSQIENSEFSDFFKDELKQYHPNVHNIFRSVQSGRTITKFFDQIQKFKNVMDECFDYFIESHYEENKKTIFNKLFQAKSNFEKRFENLEEYHKMNDDSEVGGKFGVLYSLNSILQSLASKKSFNEDKFDIVESLQRGNIVIINVEDFSDQMLNFLNHSIYTRLIHKNMLQKHISPITIFIDEAQKVLSGKSLPDVDVCRENNFEFILATQDYSLLEKQLGGLNTYLLLRNVTSQYSFKTIDPQNTKENTSKLETFECVDMIKEKKFKVEPILLGKYSLFYSEYFYQVIKKVLKYVDIQTDKQFILKYSPQIELENKVIISFKDGTSQEVDFLLDTTELDQYIQKKRQKRSVA